MSPLLFTIPIPVSSQLVSIPRMMNGFFAFSDSAFTPEQNREDDFNSRLTGSRQINFLNIICAKLISN